MKTTLSIYDFRNAFMTLRPDNFSYDGLGLLFEYMEQFEEDTGQDYELDVIALCCDFAEDEARGIAESYRIDVSGMDDEEVEQAVMDWLGDNNAFVGVSPSGIVYRSF